MRQCRWLSRSLSQNYVVIATNTLLPAQQDHSSKIAMRRSPGPIEQCNSLRKFNLVLQDDALLEAKLHRSDCGLLVADSYSFITLAAAAVC
jgi:hypothetical protein